jgi:hypothetical protein
VLAVYEALIARPEFAPERRGRRRLGRGALTVSLMADARDGGIPMPACGMLNSLWADIAMNTSSRRPGQEQLRHPPEMVVSLSETLLSTGGVDA